MLAGPVGRVGRALDDLGPVERLLGPRRPAPDLERALEVALGLGVGVHPLGLLAGADRSRQRELELVRRVPVERELRGGRGAGQVRARLELARQRDVQRLALAGQQSA